VGSAAVCCDCTQHRVRLVLYRDIILYTEHIVHLVHFVALVFIHAVDIGIHSKGYRIVPQNCRQCFVVHTALQCAGGEGVAQSVEGKVANVGVFQHTVIVVFERLLLNVVAELVGHYKAVVKVLVPCPLLTQYIASFMLNYIRGHLAFAAHPMAGKKRVIAVNGAVTSFLRKRWGIAKVRADGDLHHAVDAAVIACTTDGMIQRVSRFYQREELSHARGERFPEPWPSFRDELMQRLSSCPQENLLTINPVYYTTVDIAGIKPVFVSRMPRHKATGPAHKETIKGHLDDTYVTQRRSITDLKLNKDGEIDGYFNPSSDTLLYNALKGRLVAFGGNGKKAFAEPFFKPRADGTPGAQVRKVKLYSKVTSTVAVHGGNGVADNDTMVRVDVYYTHGDGYYWVPIYVADTVKPILPNRAVVAHKSCSGWKEMSEENFLFSLCKNDLVCIESKRPIKLKAANKDSTLEKELPVQRVLAYFEGGDISTGAVSVTTHDNAYIVRGLGFKTLQKIEKYQVDVLGNYTRVKKEKRQLFPAQRR
jgi:CRISPR-associated endonuclease Csn1